MMRLTILVVLATSEARRSRNHPNAPRDNPFVVKNTHTMRDAFIVEDLKERYHGGDQRLLNLARLGTLRDADSWIDDSFSYIRELATFTFGSDDADKVEGFAANASNLPSSFGVDIRIGSSTASLCAFAKIAAPSLRRATNVQRYVLSTVGLPGQGSPFHPIAHQRLKSECPGWASLSTALVSKHEKLRRWYVSSHSPSHHLGDRPPDRPLAKWRPRSADGYMWPRQKPPKPPGGAPVLRVVPLGLSPRVRKDEALAAASRAALAANASRPTLLEVANGVMNAFPPKLEALRRNWPDGALRTPKIVKRSHLLRAKFVACPPDKGLDAQLVWEALYLGAVPVGVKINQCVGSLSHFSAMTRPSWLGRAVGNRHRHAIEQASRRWRGGRRGDSARTRRKLLISTQVPVVEYSPITADLLRSLPHVALEKWPDARPDALVRKYDTLSRKGAMAGVLRLSRAYWRDAYRRDLYPDSSMRRDGLARRDAHTLKHLHRLLVAHRGDVPPPPPSDGGSATRVVPAEEEWE